MDLKLVVKIFIDALKISNIKYPKAEVMTFACDNDRYIDFNEKKYSPLINTLEDSLNGVGLTSISITRITSTIKGDKSHGRVFSPEGPFARALLIKRIKSLFLRGKAYPYSELEEKIWNNILIQSGVKVVIGINPSRELCTVCHKLGIWVADLQHGVISDTHPWYGAAFRGNDKREWLPDTFLCWDEGSAQTLKKWTLNRDIEVLKIGNPWVERFIQKSPSDLIFTALKEKYELPNSEKKTILVSISWGNYNIPNGFIHPELEKFILLNIDKYNWKMRLHPNQLIGFAAEEGPRFIKYFNATFPSGKVEWENATYMPLPLLLSSTDLHITWNSSVCIEASYFGISSLLLDDELKPGGVKDDYYVHIEQQGYAKKGEIDCAAIEYWVNQSINIRLLPYESYLENYLGLIQRVKSKVQQ